MRRSLLALLLFVAACETHVSSIFVATHRPVGLRAPKRPEQVQLFTSGPPAVPYTELGVLEEVVSQVGIGGTALAVELERMQADGAAQGCDAVVLGGADRAIYAGQPAFGGFWGTCIVYNRTTAAK